MGRKKKIRKIEVKTVNNGYVLSIEGARQEYMYFSPDQLVEGIFAHVATDHTDQLTRNQISNIMDAAREWKGAKKALNDIKSLQTQLDTAKRKQYQLATMVILERKDYMNLRHEVFEMKSSMPKSTDQLTFDILTAILSRHVYKPAVAYNGLGIDCDAITDDKETTDDDEDADDTTTAGR